MTKEQKQHIEKIIGDFSNLAYTKYQHGVEEHGGRLWKKNCLKELEAEIVDLVIYFFTLKKQVEDFIKEQKFEDDK